MNAYMKANAAYGAASQTVSPIAAIVMLFDGVLKQLRIAQIEDEARRPIERHEAVQKALKILFAMHATLDMEEGGDIVHSLDRFYRIVCGQLMIVTLKPDVTRRLESVVSQVREMRNAWAVRGGLSATDKGEPEFPVAAGAIAFAGVAAAGRGPARSQLT